MSRSLTISATEFKARCLDLMDQVADRRIASVIVTKRGKQIVKMTASDAEAVHQPIWTLVPPPIQIDPTIDLTQPIVDFDWRDLSIFPKDDEKA